MPLISKHQSAGSFLADIASAVNSAASQSPHSEANLNVMYSHALKLEQREKNSTKPMDPAIETPTNVWFTSRSSLDQLDFIMSATRHHLGNYPVFLTTPYRNSRLTAEFARPHIEALVEQLLLSVPKSRIYSVFGPDPIVDMFCEIIRERAGMVVDQSYYAAKFTWCTSDTLTAARPKNPLLTGTVLRQATMRDLRRAGVLCKDFADDSVFFPLSLPDATNEAREMIRNNQLWVCEVETDEGVKLASICGVTRWTNTTATISKVFTAVNCRKRGFAEHLVRHVTEHLLTTGGKSKVILYVAHDNPGAEKAYNYVGFAGLCGSGPVSGVENWIEYGFKDTDRGHW